MKKFTVTPEGYYGQFGGAHIPEVLRNNIENLKETYKKYIDEPSFKKEFDDLLRNYVGRPTPLYHSEKLSAKYKAKIYLKREDLNFTGAHKINNTIGQILLAKRMGKHRIIAETGAGQHGVATATVCALMDMDCVIYMGQMDIERQRPNVEKMRMLGAEVKAVESGDNGLSDAVDTALIDWMENPESTFYLIGSAVGPHPYPDMVAHFQSVISQEIRAQLKEQEGTEEPNYVIACVGGGSNAAGAFFHFLDSENVSLVAAEASGLGMETGKTAATLSCGKPHVLHGSNTLVLLDDKNEVLEPYSISAGLDYPGVGPLHAHLVTSGRCQVVTATDTDAMDAAFLLTKLEGIIPAIESSHALAVLGKLKFKPTDVVVVNLSGRGDKDMDTYIKIMKSKKS